MPDARMVMRLSGARSVDLRLRKWYSRSMLYYQMPMYFFAGAMCYLFPEAWSWHVAVYLGLVVLRL